VERSYIEIGRASGATPFWNARDSEIVRTASEGNGEYWSHVASDGYNVGLKVGLALVAA
jgi:hypothetical protein